MSQQQFIVSGKRTFATPYHAYAYVNIRNFAEILSDIQADKLVADIGEVFDVHFPPIDKNAFTNDDLPWN